MNLETLKEEPLLTVKETATQLRVSGSTVFNLCSRKLLGHVRIGVGRGAIRIRQSDIDAYLTQRSVEPAGTAEALLPSKPGKLKCLSLD